MKSRLLGAVCASLFLPVASIGHAITTYQYIGNNYQSVSDDTPPEGTYTTSMSITGSFTVDEPLLPASFTDITPAVQTYSFFDGRDTLTETNSQIIDFGVAVDTSGLIHEWDIAIRTTSLSSQPPQVGDQQLTIETRKHDIPQQVSTFDNVNFWECLRVTENMCDSLGIDDAFNLDLPGAWSVVPAPAAVWLFGSGLLGLVGIARRRKAA